MWSKLDHLFLCKDFIHGLLIIGKGSSSVESPSYSQPFLQKNRLLFKLLGGKHIIATMIDKKLDNCREKVHNVIIGRQLYEIFSLP